MDLVGSLIELVYVDSEQLCSSFGFGFLLKLSVEVNEIVMAGFSCLWLALLLTCFAKFTQQFDAGAMDL